MAENNNQPILFTRLRHRYEEETSSNLSIVLLNVNINYYGLENFGTVQNYIKRFEDRDECVNYITAKEEENTVHLIISEHVGAHLIPLIYELRQITSIYILKQEKLTKDEYSPISPKIQGGFVDKHVLIHQVINDLRIKHKETKYFLMKEVSSQNLTKQSAKFIWYQFFINILLQLKQTNSAKLDMLTTVDRFV
ncbi:unnamed protein product, partial [Didymodactylos carnosus]